MRALHKWLVVFATCLGTASGCATSSVRSDDLSQAQRALSDAKAQGAFHAAAIESQAAKAALLAAERCEQRRGEGACHDLNYIALRRAQLAQISSRIARAKDNERAARASLKMSRAP